jgi:hypothetical protein
MYKRKRTIPSSPQSLRGRPAASVGERTATLVTKRSQPSLATSKLVFIEWLDALAQGEWHEAKREDLQCKTVGFVVYEDAQQIELAGTITEGMCNNSITIPKQMIVKRKAITLENKLRKTKRKAAPAVDSKAVTGEVSTVDGQGFTQLSDGESR